MLIKNLYIKYLSIPRLQMRLVTLPQWCSGRGVRDCCMRVLFTDRIKCLYDHFIIYKDVNVIKLFFMDSDTTVVEC